MENGAQSHHQMGRYRQQCVHPLPPSLSLSLTSSVSAYGAGRKPQTDLSTTHPIPAPTPSPRIGPLSPSFICRKAVALMCGHSVVPRVYLYSTSQVEDEVYELRGYILYVRKESQL